jgi:hypothetical protein
VRSGVVHTLTRVSVRFGWSRNAGCNVWNDVGWRVRCVRAPFSQEIAEFFFELAAGKG